MSRGTLETQPSFSALIDAASQGNDAAAHELFGVLYAELHRLAKRELVRRGAPFSLGATTLLHLAYIEMADRDGARFPDRGRFMSYASRVMRGLIIDHVRSRRAQKRGGQFEITSMQTDVRDTPDDAMLTRVSEALDELAKVEPGLAEIVDLKFFCGFRFVEIAAMKNISERSAQRYWEKARIYLHRKLRTDLPE